MLEGEETATTTYINNGGVMECKHVWGKPWKKDGMQRCVRCGKVYDQQIDENEICYHPKWKYDGSTTRGDDHVGLRLECQRCGWIKYVDCEHISTEAYEQIRP